MEKEPNMEGKSIYKPLAGEKISEVIEQMIILAKKNKESIMAKFNDIMFTVNEKSVAKDVIAEFENKMAENAGRYQNSPKGKYNICKSEQLKKEMQQKYNILMQQLPSLDFANNVAVLDWLCNFQIVTNHIDIVKRVKHQREVLVIFAEHSYQPNMNTGKSFNSKNRDIFACFIIGQALKGLQNNNVLINPVIRKFTNDWKKKFTI